VIPRSTAGESGSRHAARDGYDRGVALDDLLAGNRAWAEELAAREPGFFTRLEAQQAPQYLWIGCSDSRVPANQITGTDPGEVFVHRNVANLVVHSDLNCLSVLQFAVDVLRVAHVVVCGHLGCGGVRAALDGARHGLVDNWLRHVQDVMHEHAALLGTTDGEARADLLCRLNVVEQVTNVCRTTIVRDAWQRGHPLQVHGVVYGLRDGILRDLGITITDAGQVVARRAATVARLAASGTGA
jgi:carbonic anhydrase